MNLIQLPWLELAIAVALFGALAVSRVRDPYRAYTWGLVLTGTSFACTLLAWLAFFQGTPPELTARYSLQQYLFGRQFLAADDLNAPVGPFGRAASLSDHRGDGTNAHAAVFVRLVDVGRGHPDRHIQLQGAVAAHRAVCGVDRSAVRRAPEPRAADAALCDSHGAVHRPPGVGLGARRGCRQLDRASPLVGDFAVGDRDLDPLRNRSRALLDDRLVRTCLAGNRPAVRDTPQRRLRRGSACLAHRARLGLAKHRDAFDLHGRLCRGDGDHPARGAAILRPPLPEPHGQLVARWGSSCTRSYRSARRSVSGSRPCSRWEVSA